MRVVLIALLLHTTAAFAFDASVPDASVGMGGPEMTSEENDMRDPCLSSRECDRGFACTNGRCVPAPVRNAAGCGGGALALLTLPLTALALTFTRRRWQ